MLPKFLKLKAILFSGDGGKTWRLDRQFYLSDGNTGELLDEMLQGLRLATIKENNHDYKHDLQPE